jgi:preprotein translocase subunit SecE
MRNMNQINKKKQDRNQDLLFKVKKIFYQVLEEAKILVTPSMQKTIVSTLVIIFMCGFLTCYFIIVGEIAVKLLKLFGVY